MLTAAATILDAPEQQARLLRLVYDKTQSPLQLRALEKIWSRLEKTCSPALNATLRTVRKTTWARCATPYSTLNIELYLATPAAGQWRRGP